MSNASDVAHYLIQLAAEEPEPDLTHMALQKLLYYVQGWSLAVTGNSMYPEPIEAWKNGPVCPSVYREFKQFQGGRIPLIQFRDVATDLSAEQRSLIQSVWESYKAFSASELWRMTHKEPPYTVPYADHQDGAGRCSAEISQQSMQEFFATEYRRRAADAGIDLVAFQKAEEEFAAGRTISMDEAFASD